MLSIKPGEDTKMPQSNILVVGSLNMDQVVRVPHIPVLGETLLGAGSLKLTPGGKGANQAVAMARLGAAVTMAGRVGDDPFGKQLLGALQADQVDTSPIVVDQEESSGVAFIFLVPDGDNVIVVSSGANMCVGQDHSHISTIFESIAQAQALVLQLEVLIVNENEASLLSGQRVDSLEDARIVATVLFEQGITRVVITLGSQGAVLATGDGTGKARIIHQPAPAVQVIDTTAAGDCFVGALTVALVEGQQPEDALRFAVYASALKVTKFGAQSGLPTRAEVEAFLHSV